MICRKALRYILQSQKISSFIGKLEFSRQKKIKNQQDEKSAMRNLFSNENKKDNITQSLKSVIDNNMNNIIDDFLEKSRQKKSNIFDLINNSDENPEWQKMQAYFNTLMDSAMKNPDQHGNKFQKIAKELNSFTQSIGDANKQGNQSEANNKEEQKIEKKVKNQDKKK